LNKIGQRFGHHLGPCGHFGHQIRNPRGRITHNVLLTSSCLVS